MTNAPKPVSAEALALLRELSRTYQRRTRPSKSPARDELKRRGFIRSEPPNGNRAGHFVLGHGHQWFPTDAGRSFLEFYGEPDGEH